MKHRFAPWVFLVAAAAVTLFLSGCSTVETRIADHPDIYHSLSPREQQLVANGQIAPGMPRDAVCLAWGSPDQKVEGAMRGHDDRDLDLYLITPLPIPTVTAYGYPYGYGRGFGFGGGLRRYAPSSWPFIRLYRRSFLRSLLLFLHSSEHSLSIRTVTFANGRVVSFQSLVGPYRY